MHMRLTWRDAASTVLLGAGVLMAASVIAGWNWPLLSGTRSGILALAVLGFASCVFGAPMERFYYTDPFGILTVVIAVLGAVVAIVGGLITGMGPFLGLLIAVSIMLWIMATLRHMVEGRTPAPAARRQLE